MPNDIPAASEVPAEDLSGRIIAEILGRGWDGGTGSDLAGGAANFFHDALSSFNWIALAFVCVLFVIAIVQGIAGTALEGVPLGRRFSSLWMPLCFAGSMTFLAPIANGLSIFQVLILMCAGYSVNLANHVWDKGLDFFLESGARVTLKTPDAVAADGEDLARGILLAETIQEYYSSRLDLPVNGAVANELRFPSVGNSPGSVVMTFTVPEGSGLPPGALGKIRVPCGAPDETACAARVAGAKTLMADLLPLARILADPERPISKAEGMILSTALENHELSTSSFLTGEDVHENERLKEDLSEFRDVASSGGWMTAGAWYWTIARLAERSKESALETSSFSGGLGPDDLEGELLSDFGPVLSRYERYVDGAFGPERSSGAGGPTPEFPTIGWFRDKTSGILGKYGLDLLVRQLQTGDPVATLASLGNFLITAAETVMGFRVASMGLASATGETSASILGQAASLFTGTASSVAAGLAQGVVLGFGPYLLALSLLLISYGFFLAYFLPALPFLLWTSGIIGWLVLLAESLVAAPLWMAAHALPEGEGLAGAHGKKGYLLFLGVLLRPPLMVFGFLMAMALVNVFGRTIGQIFSVFGFGFLGETFLGISGFLAFAAILGIVTVTAVWKLFGLMSHLPDKVVNWIGGSIHGLGETGDAQSAKSSYREVGTVTTRMLDPVAKPERPLLAKKAANESKGD
ncbi:MAG: DotA/TraY family protein [Deltaproteobacteria bacterium]|jgi:hypothetical protein|nr:DotA/TraY family protein [Deltaproteobacteria bacterium]